MKKENNHSNLGIFTHFEELGGAQVFLPNGEALLKSLVDKWREMHSEMKFAFIHTFANADPKEVHKLIFKKEGAKVPLRLASLGPKDGDFASIFCKKSALLEELISSLHFLEQTIKIFGFETRVYLRAHPDQKGRSLLKQALEQKKMAYQEESLSTEECMVEFRLKEASGKEQKGPFISLEEGGDEGICWIYRSLFGSFERWTLMLVEQTQMRSRKG